MAEAYKCDNCGVLFTDKKKSNMEFTCGVSKDRVIFTHEMEFMFQGDNKVDLCNDCLRKVLKELFF